MKFQRKQYSFNDKIVDITWFASFPSILAVSNALDFCRQKFQTLPANDTGSFTKKIHNEC